MPIFHADEGESTVPDRIGVSLSLIILLSLLLIRQLHAHPGAPSSVIIGGTIGSFLIPALLFVCVYIFADWISSRYFILKWPLYVGFAAAVTYIFWR